MASALPKRFATAKIMIVDDEPTTLDVLEMFLEEAGYENLVSVADPRRVLELLATQRPDALVLNLMMPDVDGFDVLRAMRADPALASVPAIVLTSSADPEAKRRALELGAADFLSKPVDPSELALRLRNTLAASAHRSGLERTPPVAPQPAPRGRAGSSPCDPLVSQLAGDARRVRRIVGAFADRLDAKLEEMEASLAAGDLRALDDLTHWLKGAAETVGFDAFTAPVESIRRASREARIADLAAELRALRGLAARIARDPAPDDTGAGRGHGR